MKMNSLWRHRRRIAVGAFLLFASVALSDEGRKTAPDATERNAAPSSERIQDDREAATEVNKAEVKAALAELDTQIAHLDSLSVHAPDEASRRAARARVETLKDRRDELRSDFNQARFDELRADVRREWNQFKGWVRKKADRDEPVRKERPDAAAANRAASPAHDSVLRREHDAALTRVDQELDLLHDRAEKLDSTSKEELQARINVLKDHRKDLEKNFTEERYTSLIREIRTELDRARSAAE
jgi:hypothetical protein